MTQTQETAETIVIAPPVSIPVVVEEDPTKPKGPQVNCRHGFDANGKLKWVEIRPKPGNVITRIILADIDPVTKACKVGVRTQPRRGRPRKPRPEEN
jgi:hypothetical protein